MPKRNPKPTPKGRPPKLVPLGDCADLYEPTISGPRFVTWRWHDWRNDDIESWTVAVDPKTNRAYTYCESE